VRAAIPLTVENESAIANRTIYDPQRFSASDLSGTRATTVVPRFGCDSIEISPFTKCSLSRMLMRPSASPFIASLDSNPTLHR